MSCGGTRSSSCTWVQAGQNPTRSGKAGSGCPSSSSETNLFASAVTPRSRNSLTSEAPHTRHRTISLILSLLLPGSNDHTRPMDLRPDLHFTQAPQRPPDGGLVFRFHDHQQESAAACAAQLSPFGAGRAREFIPLIDLAGRDT